jgi:DNA ligase-1
MIVSSIFHKKSFNPFLRFPRFLRERADKKPENATSAEQILDMYHSQAVTSGETGADAEQEDDDYI